MTGFGPAAAAKYVMLTTYRKDGTPVGTPLWAAMDGDQMVLWTVTDSWKVKRLRRNPAVTVQPCTLRGETSGEIVKATAKVVEGEAAERIRGLIRRKYGLTGWITVGASVLRRGKSGTCGLIVTADAAT